MVSSVNKILVFVLAGEDVSLPSGMFVPVSLELLEMITFVNSFFVEEVKTFSVVTNSVSEEDGVNDCMGVLRVVVSNPSVVLKGMLRVESDVELLGTAV